VHPELLAIVRDRRLKRAERELLLYVYGHTNGTLEAAIEVDQVLDDLGISAGTLRRMRADLEGWMRSRQRGSVLECTIERRVVARSVAEGERHERAENARRDHENARITRDEDAQKTRETGAEKSSENARKAQKTRGFGGGAERERGAQLNGIVKLKQQIDIKASGCDARAARLLRSLHVAEPIVRELEGRSLEFVAKHVADWERAKRNGKKIGVGALVNQLREWPMPADLSRGDLQEGKLAEVVTDGDLDAWGLADPLAGYDVPEGYDGLIAH
jgi:hypothetical protein